MPEPVEMDALERLLRPLRRDLSFELAQALVRLDTEADVQARYEQLAENNTEGMLSPDERAELAALVRANSLLGALKVEALAVLAGSKAV